MSGSQGAGMKGGLETEMTLSPRGTACCASLIGPERACVVAQSSPVLAQSSQVTDRETEV